MDNVKVFLESMNLGEYYDSSGEMFNKFFSTQPKMIEKVEEKNIVVRHFDSNKIYLVPLYDAHTGSKTMYKDLFERTINFIDETPNCYTVLGGDLLESATRQSIGMGVFDEDIHLSDQMRYIQRVLSPLVDKGKILGAVTGNHEMRPTYLNKWNPIEEICYDLQIPYLGFQGYLLLYVNEIPYKVFFHHGVGASRTKGAKLNASMRANQVASADLYITGHVHEAMYTSDTIFEIENEELIQKKRTYVLAGSFLQYFGGYPEMNMLSPSLPGTLLIELSGEEKSIHAHL
jgi:hypothetical protein